MDERARDTSEEAQSLWLLTISPTLWAGHFLASYLTAAVWCAKAGRGADLLGVRVAVTALTAGALAGILYTGWRGLRRHRLGRGRMPHDLDTPADRTGFLGFATVLLSGVSAVAVLYVAMPALVFGACY
jgi:hypothetical protein